MSTSHPVAKPIGLWYWGVIFDSYFFLKVRHTLAYRAKVIKGLVQN